MVDWEYSSWGEPRPFPPDRESMSGNSYELTFERRDQYLYARIETEQIDRQDVLDYLAEIIDRAAGARLRRIMIDRAVPVAPANWQDILAILTFHRVAIVNNFPAITGELQTKLEVPAHSQLDLKVFDDPREAEKWLLAEDPPEVVVFPAQARPERSS